jgi:hypothetical protein
VECPATRCADGNHRRLEQREQHLLVGRRSDAVGVAEHGEAPGEPADGLEDPHVPVTSEPLDVDAPEHETDGDSEHRLEAQRVGGAEGLVELVAGRGRKRIDVEPP